MESEYVGSTKADKGVIAKIESILTDDGKCQLAMGSHDDHTLTLCLFAIIFKLLEDHKEDLIIEAFESARCMINDKC